MINTKRKRSPSATPLRKHGPSRLEKLLQDSIRQELQIKRLQQLLVTLSFRLALVESQRERQ